MFLTASDKIKTQKQKKKLENGICASVHYYNRHKITNYQDPGKEIYCN